MLLLQAALWNKPFLYNTILDWTWAAALGIAALLLARPLAAGLASVSARIICRYLDGQHSKSFIALVRRPLASLIGLGLGYLSLAHLTWPLDRVLLHRIRTGKAAIDITIMDVVDRLFLLGIIIAAALLLSRLLDFIFGVQMERARTKNERDRQQLLPLIRDMAKIGLWTIGAFWVLGAVFDVNIPALIAGLGIGGVAIALAAKESVENFFAAFTILTDRPFQTGDSIRLGGLEGKVERIGFRSTRLRHADGSMFIVPNKALVGEKLENLSERDNRRVQIKVALKNTVPPATLESLIRDLKSGLQKTTGVQQPVSVALDSFGETALGLLLTYHLPHPADDMEGTKQTIALQVYRLVACHTGLDATVSEPAPEEAGKELDGDQSSSTDNP